MEFKNPQEDLERFRSRLTIAGGFVLLCFGALFARFVWLQVVQHDYYQTRAEDNRISLVPIVPNRGLIVDRNGVVLARNYSAYTLEITPAKIRGELETAIDELAGIIDVQPKDRKRFKKLLEESKNFESLPIRTRLTDDEVAKFVARRYRFPGVDIKARLFRQYPAGAFASHMLGYIGRINDHDLGKIDEEDQEANYRGTDHFGKTGLEQHYEFDLHGITGFEQVEVDAGGHAVRTLARTAPVAGNNLSLTIDVRLQEIAEKAFGDRKGSLVAIEPATGGILALVSVPNYDPNLFVDGIATQDWEELNTSPDKPMVNRALNGAYPPGSTFKPYMALAALTLGKRRPEQTIFDPGFYNFGNHTFRDDKKGGHGSVDMYKSIVASCDTYYYMLANDLGIDNIASFMRQFGFGQRTGVDIDGESEGVLPSQEWKSKRFKKPEQQKWYAGETISIGIGQGYNAYTPIQLAQAMATLANNGVMFRPASGQTCDRFAHRRNHADRRAAGADHSAQAGAHRRHQARHGRREQGGHRRTGLRRGGLRIGRQDRHGPGVFVEGRPVQGKRRQEGAARSCALHRLRAGRPTEDRPGRTGRKRRFRRSGGGADRPSGAGLLPARQGAECPGAG